MGSGSVILAILAALGIGGTTAAAIFGGGGFGGGGGGMEVPNPSVGVGLPMLLAVIAFAAYRYIASRRLSVRDAS